MLCVQWETPDDEQRNCPKHAEFHSKNRFEKLVHLFGFTIRIYHDARSHERQIHNYSTLGMLKNSLQFKQFVSQKLDKLYI
jgi:hypothetical protein